MKFFLTLLSVLGFSVAMRGQQFDNPTLIPVSYFGYSFTQGTGGSSFNIGPNPTFSANASSATYVEEMQSPTKTAYLTPGKEYNVTVNSTNCQVSVTFLPIGGYDVYLDNAKASSIARVGATYTFKLRVELANDIARQLDGKRGGATISFPTDKPIWYIGLGSLRNGRPAGAVGFRMGDLSPSLYNTSSLFYATVDPAEVSVTRDSNGYIQRIDARDVVLMMDPYDPSGNSYSIRAYFPVNLTTPFITYTVSNYNNGGGIRIDKVEDGQTWSTILAKSGSTWTRYDWQKVASSSSALVSNAASVTSISGSTASMSFGTGTGSTVGQKTFTTVNAMTELASQTGGTAGAAQTTSYSYYADATGAGWPNALSSAVEPSGRWVKYEYYNVDSRQGQISRIYRPWLDSPSTASSATFGNSYVETRDYSANYDFSTTAPASKVITINGTEVARTTWSYNWNHSLAGNIAGGASPTYTVAEAIQREYTSAGSYLTSTKLAFREDCPNSFLRGKPHSLTKPDGTRDSYAYFNGTWNPTTRVFSAYSPGGARQMLVFHGQAASDPGATGISSWDAGQAGDVVTWKMDQVYLVPNLSTVTEVVVNAHGQVVLTREHAYTGGSNLEMISGQANTFNGNNLVSVQRDLARSVAGAGGEVEIVNEYTAGLLTAKTDIDGTKTTWAFDDLLRNTVITTAANGSGNFPAKPQTFTYYTSGLRASAKDDPSSSEVTTYSYDNAGRLTAVNEPKPGGGTLTTVHSYPTARSVSVTLPSGATKVTEYYLDGRLKSESGSAQMDARYEYSFDSNHLTKRVNRGSNGIYGWTEEKSDWLGRSAILRTPQVGWNSSPTKITKKTYTYSPTTGALTAVSTLDEGTGGSPRLMPDHLYEYGLLGMLTREGDDVNSNGTLDAASADRIVAHETLFYKDTSGYNGWIKQEVSETLRTTNNGSQWATLTDRRTRLTNFNSGAMYGGAKVISDVVSVDASGRVSSVWERVDSGARQRVRWTTFQGTVQSTNETWQDGYLKSQQSHSGVTKTYAYNNAGLVASVTEGVTNAVTTNTYFPGTKYVASTSNSTGVASTSTTSYSYSWNTTEQSHTVAQTIAASPTNIVTRTEYNALGLPWRTWGTGVTPSLQMYDAIGRRTGLLTWRSGDFTGSTWPLMLGGDLTSWNLDSATGVVLEKVYPDSSKVTYSYNPRGQTKTRTWARTPAVTTTYNYFDSSGNLTGELQGVDYSDSTPDVQYTYTRFGAIATVTDATGTRTFNYRSDLKLDNETLSGFYGSRVLTTTYDGSIPGLANGHSFNGSPSIGTSIGFSSTTGRAETISGSYGGSTAPFTLGYASGTDVPTSVTSATYSSFSRTATLVPRYDVVASTATQWGGAALGSFTAAYGDVRGWKTEHGSGAASGAPAGSWSKVLGLGDGIKWGFGYSTFGELTSAPTPTWQNAAGTADLSIRNWGWSYDVAGNRLTETGTTFLTNYSTDALNRYTSITGTRAEPGITYDADGNLTKDGMWTYAYDAENRLVSANRTVPTTINLTYAYDYLGRRVRKTDATAEIKFLWQGWTLLADLQSDGYTARRSYVWGPDQTGGWRRPGALLGMYSATHGLTFAMPDALGNIVGYVNTSGSIAAAVEYSAYGKGMNAYLASGALSDFPIGFGGEYMDWELGVVYYGRRYYAPKHGRFINRDPIEEDGGLNLYGFCGNNPANRWDHLGMAPSSEWFFNGWGLVSGFAQAGVGGAIGISLGWTGIGAVGGGLLLVNGTATFTASASNLVSMYRSMPPALNGSGILGLTTSGIALATGEQYSPRDAAIAALGDMGAGLITSGVPFTKLPNLISLGYDAKAAGILSAYWTTASALNMTGTTTAQLSKFLQAAAPATSLYGYTLSLTSVEAVLSNTGNAVSLYQMYSPSVGTTKSNSSNSEMNGSDSGRVFVPGLSSPASIGTSAVPFWQIYVPPVHTPNPGPITTMAPFYVIESPFGSSEPLPPRPFDPYSPFGMSWGSFDAQRIRSNEMSAIALNQAIIRNKLK